jgi:hypothetical protein
VVDDEVPRAPAEAPTEPAAGASVRERVRHAYRRDMGSRERAALLSWLGFTTTFGSVRAITHAIRAGAGPFGNMSFGGEHLHHYMWGIGMLAGVGGVAVHGPQRHRHHPATALSYGAGLALIVDEFALLLDLKDVYWAKEGRVSVDLGVGAAALGGTALAATPILRRLLHRTPRA